MFHVWTSVMRGHVSCMNMFPSCSPENVLTRRLKMSCFQRGFYSELHSRSPTRTPHHHLGMTTARLKASIQPGHHGNALRTWAGQQPIGFVLQWVVPRNPGPHFFTTGSFRRPHTPNYWHAPLLQTRRKWSLASSILRVAWRFSRWEDQQQTRKTAQSHQSNNYGSISLCSANYLCFSLTKLKQRGFSWRSI